MKKPVRRPERAATVPLPPAILPHVRGGATAIEYGYTPIPIATQYGCVPNPTAVEYG